MTKQKKKNESINIKLLPHNKKETEKLIVFFILLLSRNHTNVVITLGKVHVTVLVKNTKIQAKYQVPQNFVFKLQND